MLTCLAHKTLTKSYSIILFILEHRKKESADLQYSTASSSFGRTMASKCSVVGSEVASKRPSAVVEYFAIGPCQVTGS